MPWPFAGSAREWARPNAEIRSRMSSAKTPICWWVRAPAEIMPPMMANRFFTLWFISRSISSRVSARAYSGETSMQTPTIRLRSPLRVRRP